MTGHGLQSVPPQLCQAQGKGRPQEPLDGDVCIIGGGAGIQGSKKGDTTRSGILGGRTRRAG